MQAPDTSNPRAREASGLFDPRPPAVATNQPSIPAARASFEASPSETADLFGPGAGGPAPVSRVLCDRHLRRLLDPPARAAAERAIRGLLEQLGEEATGGLLAVLAEVAESKDNPGGWVLAETRRCVSHPDIRQWWASKRRAETTPGALAPVDPLGASRGRVVEELEYRVKRALGRPERPPLWSLLDTGRTATPLEARWADYTAAAARWEDEHGRAAAEYVALATRAVEVLVVGGVLVRPEAERAVWRFVDVAAWGEVARIASGEVRP